MLDGYLGRQLQELRAVELFRDPADCGARALMASQAAESGRPFFDVCSNDYLGFAAVPPNGVSRETPIASPGAGASRLVQGTHVEHELLEDAAASWVRQPAALLFSSGYAANLGVLAALTSEGAAVFSDQLNHASIADGCRLGRGRISVIPHLNLPAVDAALAAARGASTRWVVTESYFSMDGDAPNLPALRALCDRHRAFLVVDEAHALGVFGPEGAGLCAANEVRADVLLGMFGKAVGTQGGFAAGSETLRTFLWNRARTFVFSTAPSPELSATTRAHLRAVREAEGLRRGLLARCAELRLRLSERKIPVLSGSFGPIVPLLAGSSARATQLALALRSGGVLAQPIRPPTVPEGSARIRLTLTERIGDADLEPLSDAIAAAWRA